MAGVLAENEACTRVRGNPFDLPGGGGFVDRHANGAGEPQRPVDECPFETCARHDRHAITGLETLVDEPLREALDERDELGCIHGRPCARCQLALPQGDIGVLCAAQEEEISDVFVGFRLSDLRCFELA